jgi:hypothetical protein
LSKAFPETKFLYRLFLYFKFGHSQYFTFLTGLTTFIVIVYTLFIERFPFLITVFPSITSFVLLFAPVYIVLTVLVGRWHTVNQLQVQQVVMAHKNPPLKTIIQDLDKIKRKLDIV